MRILVIGLVVSVALVALIEAAPPELCKEAEENEPKCEETEYKKYMKCLEERKERRKKRQIVCPYAQQQVLPAATNCDAHAMCVAGCQGNASCSSLCPACTFPIQPVAGCPVEYNTCVGNCNSNVNCQVGCQRLCPNEYKSVVIQGTNGDQDNRIDTLMTPGRNITTVIKLNNYINNTNVVNVPTNVNATHVNNIHIYTNTSRTGGKYGLGYSKKGDCCISVRPKSCHASSQGYRCHHKRRRTCGHQCNSKIIHAVPRQRCSYEGSCEERVAYVPQPRPRCVHHRQWPYVTCGGRQESSCEGCYEHYGYGYDNYYGDQGPECHGCYDDGFEYGQMYRRGPVLRPHYYHEPPCFLTGTCYDGYDVDCGYGCYGHEYIDPAWGFGPHHHPRPRPPHHRPPIWQDTDEEGYFPEEIDDDSFIQVPLNETDFNEDDFDIPVRKCKVIGDDNKVTIRNCTMEDLNNNPYAARPMSKHPYYSEEAEDRMFHRRRYDYDPYYYHYNHHSPRRAHSHRFRQREQTFSEFPFDDDENTSGEAEDTDFYVREFEE